jgi:hypothetical protein
MKKCECGNDVMETGAPKTVLQFTIPFTKIEIIVWNWGVKDYSDHCMDCIIEMEQNKMRDHTDQAYTAGYEHGYEQANKEF